MNDAVITFKTNSKIKAKAMKVADDLGFSLSSLINAYLRDLIRTKRVNFNLSDESRPTDFFVKGIEESQADIKAGKVSPSFDNAQDAIKWLRSDKGKV